MLSLIIGLFFACGDKDNGGFSASGTGVSPNDLGPTGSGSSSEGDEPGTGEDFGDQLEEASNEDAPQISQIDAFFTEYEGLGDLIEVHIYYSDTQDDLEGGQMSISYSNGSDSGSDNIDLTQSNASALLEEGEVTLLFTDVDTATDYSFLIRLTDVEGNQSNEFIATAASVE